MKNFLFKILIVLFVLGASCFAKPPYGYGDVRNNYLMHFYPEPMDGSCIITEVVMKPYKVTTNQYGYKDIRPKYRSIIHLRRDRSGVFEMLQSPYLPNTQWWAFYKYKKKVITHGKFGEVVTGWLYGSGVIKNIPEGKPVINLPCRGAGFFGRVKERASQAWDSRQHYFQKVKEASKKTSKWIKNKLKEKGVLKWKEHSWI